MKAIKAKEIDKKFDEGEDISKYLDLSKVRRPPRVKGKKPLFVVGSVIEGLFRQKGFDHLNGLL